MTERELIEEMTKDYKLCYPCEMFDGYVDEDGNLANGFEEKCRCITDNEPTRCSICRDVAKVLIGASWRKVDEGAVVLTREEYEKLKSLYNCQQGAYMTSSIGDIPLTIEGLRKVVDEISRLNIVQAELQKLNANYYNEAKDLRRKLEKVRKETAREILEKAKELKLDTANANCLISEMEIWIRKQFGVEVW